MKTNLRILSLFTIFVTFFMTACATRLDVISPASTDFTGRWVINENLSQPITLASGQETQNRPKRNESSDGKRGGAKGSRSAKRSQQTEGGGRSSQRLTPAMKSKEMTIEQNHDSMGVSYPNEIYRDIFWGKKEFYRETVDAGWQDNSLIVKSISDQVTLTESYQLNSTQDVLTLTINIKNKRGTNEFIRLFDLAN